ncbi:MAG: tRNA guanosine(34) transglycosylase Tgt [Candidatus Marinimicrobia bacterium]|nr:tRNA guanosine(34) transglycosylase Tgt [Candidatus Neomarinimicrobiota bacterium]MBL7022557.1 tRNA guanosine(34) transglycosylase Tgt [Candidatus Neomarinimicrobiota bacterium]MBL7108913.1 tRNA guanosine(34) transglycosylase Tgt [Candidatus Neomarinimicrobiota bacterium]
MKSIFKIQKLNSTTSARAGVVQTGHGEVETPFFMPVGTYGAVKTQSSEEIADLPSKILLGNTYHLFLRPGTEILQQAGGLHGFMNWDGAILTDSGGFQIFSLEGFRKITDDGVTFQSHLDGSKHHFTPERIVDIQRIIGSDFMMMLDVCPPGDADNKVWMDALKQTTAWAKRGMEHYRNSEPIYGYHQILLPIVQGGTNSEMRKQSADELVELNAEAYAIGGLAVGEPKPKMLDTVQLMDECLPKEKPRYLMGVGTPADLVRNVARGVDMFDCVMPTRNARNGQLFTANGKINIRNAKFKNDFNCIDDSGISPMSKIYTKSYLHHLFKTEEILGYRIATQQNLKFYVWLMNKMRKEILNESFEKWANDFLMCYEGEKL